MNINIEKTENISLQKPIEETDKMTNTIEEDRMVKFLTLRRKMLFG